MNHLNDDQLSARLDGALNASDDAAAGRHLDDCTQCRDRLAALSELDLSLRGALTHDPGEAYFASFADRVSEKIVAAPGTAAAEAHAPSSGGGLFGWWRSPRALTFVGSTAALVAVAALALVLSRDQGADKFAQQLAPKSEVGSQVAPPDQQPAPHVAEPKPEQPETPSPTSEAAPAPRTAQSGRAQEMRTLPNGEQVPVAGRAMPFSSPPPAASIAGPQSSETRVRKPQSASPMNVTPTPAPEPMPVAASARAKDEAAVPQREVADASPPPAAVAPAAAPATEPARKSRFDVTGLFKPARPGTSTTQEVTPSQTLTPPAAGSSTPFAAPQAPQARTGERSRGIAAPDAKSRFLQTPYQAAVAVAEQAERAGSASRLAAEYDRAALAWAQAATLTRDDALVLQSRRSSALARLSALRLQESAARRSDAVAAFDAWIAAAPEGPQKEEARRRKDELGR